ncbi:BamA/TamA family outer membrane protein [Hydrogenimonas thermophila]|uniref:Translocation and assembly module TamA n=1 Tax=Hydrogenimonas thermophila TaxID=223786 RepID=A0A1I5QPY7_9BACT|nr:BamA/TamA family outer membrane protein [Hydrogenimonas thermophila]SFP47926.1 translocation and assembly module TamA [Hydrogenimonas thermophila]
MIRFITAFIILTHTLYAAALPVKFSGNKTFSDRTLYEVIGLKPPLFFEFWKSEQKLDPNKVKALTPLIENFYKSHGFYNAKAKSDIKDNTIVFLIKENEPIKVAKISAISALDIKPIIPFHNQDRFDPEAFVKSKKEIRKFYANHQYCNVELNAKAYVDIEKNLAYIVYDVKPNEKCFFGKISIETKENISPEIIKSLLYFKQGDPYSTELIKRSYKEIYANEGIDRVIIDDSRHNGKSVPVDVKVSAYPKPIHIKAGAGFSSDEGINLLMGIKHRNILGDLKTVGIEARYSQIKSYIQIFTDVPLVNHYRLGGNIAIKREIYDGYNEESLITRVDLKRSIFPHRFRGSIFYEDIATTDSNDPINFPNGKLQIFSPEGSWEVDRRDSIIEPSKGYRLNARVMGSIKSQLSDATYYKLFLSGSYHLPVSFGVTSFRLKYGAIKLLQGRIPPSYRFYAGGMNSNRAYNFRQLGPQNSNGDPIGAFSITEGSVELRFPLSESFKAVLFTDITYLGDTTLPDYQKPYISIGPGIRYKTPIGPIALDVGFDFNDFSRFAIHFHIGELF